MNGYRRVVKVSAIARDVFVGNLTRVVGGKVPVADQIICADHILCPGGHKFVRITEIRNRSGIRARRVLLEILLGVLQQAVRRRGFVFFLC
ncbi:hypothetical protein ACWGSK_21080 [Nocardiopsis sp. NPDC055551]